MKPALFEYFAPTSLAEAVDLAARFGYTQKVLAGGQSLVPLMNMRLARPDQLIDLNKVTGLDAIRDENGQVCVGALVRHDALDRSPAIRVALPLLSEAVPYIGHPQIRNRGTVGGSVSHADPAAEIPTVLVAYGGEVVAASTRGERTVNAADLFVSVFTTSLEVDEVVTEIRFAKPPLASGSAFMEVAKRHGDFALVSTAVMISVASGTIADARIAVGSVADRPIRIPAAETLLRGAPPDRDAFAAAAALVSEEVRPGSDVNASADYRRHVAGVLTRRCLEVAFGRIRE